MGGRPIFKNSLSLNRILTKPLINIESRWTLVPSKSQQSEGEVCTLHRLNKITSQDTDAIANDVKGIFPYQIATYDLYA